MSKDAHGLTVAIILLAVVFGMIYWGDRYYPDASTADLQRAGINYSQQMGRSPFSSFGQQRAPQYPQAQQFGQPPQGYGMGGFGSGLQSDFPPAYGQPPFGQPMQFGAGYPNGGW